VSAADLLRTALDDAGPLRVETDAYGDRRIWDGDYVDVMAHSGTTDHRAAMRLIGLLLAAAPHLADLIDSAPGGVDRSLIINRVRRAITEAGETL